MSGPSRRRGQSGLDRLLLFVVVAVALVLVAPHVLGFVGIDVRESTGSPPATADHDLAILAARGGAVDDARSSVGTVRLVVTPQPGRAPVDLGQGAAVWIGDETFDLVPVGAAGDDADGVYRVAGVDGGSPVLDGPTDRGVVEFDLGTDDVDDVPEFADRLSTGESATVTLVTPRGEVLTRQVTVPAEIPPDADQVWL